VQSFSWYLNRLSLMSFGEIAWRARCTLTDRLSPWISPRRVPAADESLIDLAAWAPPARHTAASYIQAADKVLSGRVDLYGTWVQAGSPQIDWNRDPISGVRSPLQYGKSLDYRDKNLVGSARDVWELNRHFQLVCLAQAWAVSGDEQYRIGATESIASWLRACPHLMGINWASALEHGIRLINWYLAARILRLDTSRCVDAWLESIYRHSEFIWHNRSRHSSANNHLIGEMAGLYVASCGWGCWPVSAEWRRDAKQILEQEARRQVTADGVSREQTVGYQVFVLQFLIVAGLVGEAFGDAFSAEYWRVVKNMMRFLRSIADSGGNLPNFGDSDDGVVFLLGADARRRRLADLLELESEFSAAAPSNPPIADSATSWLLSGFAIPRDWPSGVQARQSAFPEGGYFVLGDRFGEPSEVSLVFDAAPLGYLSIAAHGHADCLSFVLSLGGEQILIDPGTYVYHADAEWRDYFRSTAAHNTLRVDGADQSEMGGAFMWLRKAHPLVEVQDLGGPIQRLRARHDGYRRLADPVVHSRDLVFDAVANSITVTDEIHARDTHLVEQFWHFSDGCQVRAGDHKCSLVVEGRVAIVEFKFDSADPVSLYRGSESPRAGWVSHNFGSRTPTTTAVVRARVSGIACLRTTIHWRFL
jgi:hypothetical protein